MSSVLVINSGSSSVKFAIYDSPEATTPVIVSLAERLNETGAVMNTKGAIQEQRALGDGADHRKAVQAFIDVAKPWLSNLQGIGHRVVHGGELFSASTLMTADDIAKLATLNALAPLHNPMNVMGLEACAELFEGVPQVAVFDTSFHQSLQEHTYLYGVPYEWYEQYGVRRYGFHGTSYRFVTQEAARRLNKKEEDVNLLIAHLGNGCSAVAVRCGQSVDSSMGLTPLEGLIMGTRCGELDPGLIEHMLRNSDMTFEEVMNHLNRNSGLKGLSGIGNDMRTLLEEDANGHEGATRALNVFSFRVARTFAALSASLPIIDAVVFTGGIGENAASVRQRTLAAWRNLNFRLDEELNNQGGDELGRITQAGSPLAMVVRTDEQRMIAMDTYALTSA